MNTVIADDLDAKIRSIQEKWFKDEISTICELLIQAKYELNELIEKNINTLKYQDLKDIGDFYASIENSQIITEDIINRE